MASATGKRARGGADGVGENECPVCFCPMGDAGEHTIARPFECSHPICRRCDRRMYQGHDDRCPMCRAERSGGSIAENGHRPPGIPVHERREAPVGPFSLETFFFADDDSEGMHYVSAITRPGEDQLFASLEELLSNAERSHGISRARVAAAPPGLIAALQNLTSVNTSSQREREAMGRHVASAMRAINDDPALSAAMDGLRNPVEVPLGTFLDRVRGTAGAAQAQAGRQSGPRLGFARRRQALAARGPR